MLSYGEGKYFSPDDDLGILSDPTVDPPEENEDDDEDDKETDDDVTDDDKTPKEGEDEEGEDNENEEEDEDDKEDNEEEEESEEDLDRSTRASDVKKEFPEIFKKFPDLKGALYREERYSEIFGSVEDAETAHERSQSLAAIENDLLVKGDPTKLLDALAKENKDSFTSITENTIRYAQEHDKDLYLKLAGLPIKQMLRAAWRQGNGNKTDLGKAAAHIHNFFFENYNFDEKVELEGGATGTKGKTKEQEAYENRLNTLEEKEYRNFESSVNQSYVKRVDSTVRETLEKDQRLTPYMRDKLVEDVMMDIKKQLSNDSRYMKQMESLWKQAKTAGFTNDFKSRIISTALARAKSLVPDTRKKLLAKALGKGKVKDKEDTNSNNDNKKRIVRPERGNERRQEVNKPKTDLEIMRS